MEALAPLTRCACEDGRFCRCLSQVKHARQRAQAYGYVGGHFTAREWLTLLERYGCSCLACGAVEDLSVDHIVPLSLGGSNAITNVQPLCETCNNLKGARVRDYRPVEVYLP
jgi:5-methylcytosine-specific restriction endonuclease McrA